MNKNFNDFVKRIVEDGKSVERVAPERFEYDFNLNKIGGIDLGKENINGRNM